MQRASGAMLTVLLLGCGAGSAGQESENAASGVAETCPGTWQEAVKATCHWMGPIDRCTYEEATCDCSPDAQCGGATPEPPGPGDPGTYRCRSVDPDRPLLREDGCPQNLPAVGDPCSDEGDVCGYTGCPWQTWDATCTEGAWSVENTYDGPLPM